VAANLSSFRCVPARRRKLEYPTPRASPGKSPKQRGSPVPRGVTRRAGEQEKPLASLPSIDAHVSAAPTERTAEPGEDVKAVGDALRAYMAGIDKRVAEAAAHLADGPPYDRPLVPPGQEGHGDLGLEGHVALLSNDREISTSHGVAGTTGAAPVPDQALLEDLVVYNALESALIEARAFMDREAINDGVAARVPWNRVHEASDSDDDSGARGGGAFETMPATAAVSDGTLATSRDDTSDAPRQRRGHSSPNVGGTHGPALNGIPDTDDVLEDRLLGALERLQKVCKGFKGMAGGGGGPAAAGTPAPRSDPPTWQHRPVDPPPKAPSFPERVKERLREIQAPRINRLQAEVDAYRQEAEYQAHQRNRLHRAHHAHYDSASPGHHYDPTGTYPRHPVSPHKTAAAAATNTSVMAVEVLAQGPKDPTEEVLERIAGVLRGSREIREQQEQERMLRQLGEVYNRPVFVTHERASVGRGVAQPEVGVDPYYYHRQEAVPGGHAERAYLRGHRGPAAEPSSSVVADTSSHGPSVHHSRSSGSKTSPSKAGGSVAHPAPSSDGGDTNGGPPAYSQPSSPMPDSKSSSASGGTGSRASNELLRLRGGAPSTIVSESSGQAPLSTASPSRQIGLPPRSRPGAGGVSSIYSTASLPKALPAVTRVLSPWMAGTPPPPTIRRGDASVTFAAPPSNPVGVSPSLFPSGGYSSALTGVSMLNTSSELGRSRRGRGEEARQRLDALVGGMIDKWDKRIALLDS